MNTICELLEGEYKYCTEFVPNTFSSHFKPSKFSHLSSFPSGNHVFYFTMKIKVKRGHFYNLWLVYLHIYYLSPCILPFIHCFGSFIHILPFMCQISDPLLSLRSPLQQCFSLGCSIDFRFPLSAKYNQNQNQKHSIDLIFPSNHYFFTSLYRNLLQNSFYYLLFTLLFFSPFLNHFCLSF